MKIKMLQFIKKNDKGMAHVLAPLVFIVGFAIIGAGALVVSHAAPLPTYSATCAINNVPASLSRSATMVPTITVINTGTGVITPYMISFSQNPNGNSTYFREVNTITIPACGSATTAPLLFKYSPSLVVNASTGTGRIYAHSDLNYSGTHVFFQCSKTFTIN